MRRCAYIFCSQPLPVRSRSDRRFCSARCKVAARRWRRHFEEAVEIGLSYTLGRPTEQVVRCPSCGQRFALGHGHRRDSRYCGPACRQAAATYRARKAAEQVREGVKAPCSVVPPGTRFGALTSTKPVEFVGARTVGRSQSSSAPFPSSSSSSGERPGCAAGAGSLRRDGGGEALAAQHIEVLVLQRGQSSRVLQRAMESWASTRTTSTAPNRRGQHLPRPVPGSCRPSCARRWTTSGAP